MSRKNLVMRAGMLVVLAAVVAVPTYAGSAVVGSVAGTKDAMVGGQTLLPNTTLFSGDSLQVKEGVAVIALGQGSRMVLGQHTAASFLREGDGVTALLGEGNISMYHPEEGMGMRVKIGGMTVAPAQGFKTLGEVAMLNGTVIVTTKEGKLKVEGNGPAVEVTKGKSVTLQANPAPAPQAGAPVSGLTIGQVATIAGAGAAAVGTGFSIAAKNKANDALVEAQASTAAAQASAAAAKAACQAAASPSVPSACQ
jgi:hypothetical protein